MNGNDYGLLLAANIYQVLCFCGGLCPSLCLSLRIGLNKSHVDPLLHQTWSLFSIYPRALQVRHDRSIIHHKRIHKKWRYRGPQPPTNLCVVLFLAICINYILRGHVACHMSSCIIATPPASTSKLYACGVVGMVVVYQPYVLNFCRTFSCQCDTAVSVPLVGTRVPPFRAGTNNNAESATPRMVTFFCGISKCFIG